jgi:hypothetical protein
MKNKKIYRQKMYSLVLYSLAPMQKGIQAGHANDIYQFKYGSKSPEFKQWITKDLTVIVLDGGPSWALTKHTEILKKHKIQLIEFVEPDNYNNVTAVSFLVDERVWDKETYPDLLNVDASWDKAIFLREFLSQFKLAN